MTAWIIELFQYDMESSYSSFFIIFDSDFGFEIKFIQFIIFNFLLDCFFHELID